MHDKIEIIKHKTWGLVGYPLRIDPGGLGGLAGIILPLEYFYVLNSAQCEISIFFKSGYYPHSLDSGKMIVLHLVGLRKKRIKRNKPPFVRLFRLIRMLFTFKLDFDQPNIFKIDSRPRANRGYFFVFLLGKI